MFESFEYLCYGSTTIYNILILLVRGSTLDVRMSMSESDIYRGQILTSKVDPHAIKVKTTQSAQNQHFSFWPLIHVWP